MLPLTLALAASACATPKTSTAFADCESPVLLPARDLTRAEVVAFWAQDRAALVTCRARHAAAAGVDPAG
uniref:hypothetical protein n=1 Tax=Xinfangfangia pollutisoli TaxID=2865960 RepID=UPI001CD4CCCD